MTLLHLILDESYRSSSPNLPLSINSPFTFHAHPIPSAASPHTPPIYRSSRRLVETRLGFRFRDEIDSSMRHFPLRTRFPRKTSTASAGHPLPLEHHAARRRRWRRRRRRGNAIGGVLARDERLRRLALLKVDVQIGPRHRLAAHSVYIYITLNSMWQM